MYRRILIAAISFFLSVSAWVAFAGVKPPGEGEMLPEIALTVPFDPAQQAYLGLSGEESFTIPQIKAKVVIVEIFSMYCPYCQKEAPIINELYRKIQNNSQLKNSVKLIGIGAGNTFFEVNHFRDTYQVPFPLFSDSDFSIHKKIGQVRTPYFFGIKINDDGTHRILCSKPGRLEDPDKFLDTLIQRAGLK